MIWRLTVHNILFVFSIITYLLYSSWKYKKYIHILQLNSYMNSRYLKWVLDNPKKLLEIKDLIPIIAIVPLFFNKIIIAYLLWVGGYTLLYFLRPVVVEKKKLAITGRVKRLFITASIIFIEVVLVYLSFSDNFQDAVILGVLFFGLFIFNSFSFAMLILINSINLPIEKSINQWYINDAKKKLKAMPNLKVIGLTGSFGKTSTKFFLYRILSQKYNVLMTPESYNTTLGVTKTIRTSLKAIHEIFIVEMGAKQKGDIKEICDLVSPQQGILTAIGEQHLESFKKIETIRSTKYELINSLPHDGIAFLNMDDANIRQGRNTISNNVVSYGIEAKGLNYWAKDIKFTSKGTTFTVQKQNGENGSFDTKLLGKHNVYNLLASIAVASEMGLDFNTISYGIKNIEPVPHRLQLKQTDKITILDDAFNSNPVGSRMALEVLQEIEGNQKVLVTPGMVELGEKEYEANKEFGKLAAKACDYIILVGPKRTIPIQDGINEANFPQEKLYIAKDLSDAIQQMNLIVQTGSVVLFENDLPDTYNE